MFGKELFELAQVGRCGWPLKSAAGADTNSCCGSTSIKQGVHAGHRVAYRHRMQVSPW